MKKKIIHILCHSLPNDSRRDYYIFGNWAARLARSLSAHDSTYTSEVWYAMRDLDKVTELTKDGILYKLFPAKTLHPLLESFFAVVESPELFKAIAKEDPRNTIIHLQGERGSILHTLLRDFSQIPMVIQYHGYGQHPLLDWMEKLFILPQEKKNFPHVKHFLVHIKQRIKYLKDMGIPAEKISYQNVGVNFDIFKPSDRSKARKKLHLPPDAFIMMYVGSMVKTKGVDKIIAAYELLKKKYPQLYLLFIGANKTDPLYEEAVMKADNVLSLINNEDVPLYYNAANVYCFVGDTKTTLYAGIGTAPTEALACNINVISTNLIHLPDEIVDKVGFIPKNFDEFVQHLEYLITHPQYNIEARDLVAPFTATDHMMNNLMKIYARIFTPASSK